jgi:hypothetical protein
MCSPEFDRCQCLELLSSPFQKCNEYFVKRWDLTQRNLAKLRRFGKAEHEHLKEAEELAKQHIEPYGPHRHIFNVRGKGDTSMGGERYGGRNY